MTAFAVACLSAARRLRAGTRLGLWPIVALGLAPACRSSSGPASAGLYDPSRDLGALFQDVQLARLFPDSKTFVDAQPLLAPADIVTRYDAVRASGPPDLPAFVAEHFVAPQPAGAGVLTEFAAQTITEADLGSGDAGGKVVIRDRIADSMFQQVLLRPDEYAVLATPNLNGDYLSDACAAQVGGLGMAPGANMGDGFAVFEATHGTAPKYAGQDKVNPSSVILSGVMMLEELGWGEAGELMVNGIQGAIAAKTVTYDLARQMPGATEVKSSGFAYAIIKHMER